MALRSTRDRRLLLEHPLEGRAHLVEVGLRLRLDRDHEGRARVDRAGRGRSGRSFVERVSPVRGRAELGDGADLARLQLADRLLLLAVEAQQLADPLVLALLGVPGVGLAAQRPGQDAEVGEPADERVGGGLEDADEERAARRRAPPRPGRPTSARAPTVGGSSAGVGR